MSEKENYEIFVVFFLDEVGRVQSDNQVWDGKVEKGILRRFEENVNKKWKVSYLIDEYSFHRWRER